jgi:5-(aminomethyl)-3-furanmethanol phosphate kinase
MIRVIKVGGSLFELPDLTARMERVLTESPAAVNVLLAGGGALARTIREAQSIHQLTDENAHWLCIKAMSVSALGLKMILRRPSLKVIAKSCTIREDSQTSLWIFDAERLLQSEQACEAVRKLPRNWSTSSDSIAAALSVELRAEELVLLKSTGWRNDLEGSHLSSLRAASSLGLVDDYFAEASLAVPKVGWIDLRGSEYDCKWIKATQ